MRKAFAAVSVIGLLMSMGWSSVPAGASVFGSASFNCNVFLPVWPLASGGGVECLGTSSAVLAGKTSTNVTYVVKGTGRFFDGHAIFYDEGCTANEPLHGYAQGTAYITGLSSQTPPGLSANVQSRFEWVRTGATAIIALPPGGSIYFSNGAVANETGAGRAVATFRPTSPGVGGRDCTHPGTQVANIIGVAQFNF
jgi:hypothetical protein